MIMLLPAIFGFLVAAIVSGLGILMLISPVRYSRILNSLQHGQLDVLRGGSLFDMYFPERVERSHSLRNQIRRLGVAFFAVGILIAFQVSQLPIPRR
ncbi:MAG TPA: hypothetical protein VLM42_19085 [Bryobacteraceae bacterium]|nr:hypothetical protein [Bryobacteraceae bacterium]